MRYSIALLVLLVACGGGTLSSGAGGHGGAGGHADAGGDGAEDADAREMPDALPTKEASTP